MKIFYLNIDEFKQKFNKKILEKYADIEIKTEKRFYEYTSGRYLVKNVIKNIYKTEDFQIILNENGKPVLKNSKIHFSLSHSKNITIACFDEAPCGIDIEYMKKRNLSELSKYIEKPFKTQEEFYRYWTLKEAEYKLGENSKYNYYSVFENYFLTVVSNKKFDKETIILRRIL